MDKEWKAITDLEKRVERLEKMIDYHLAKGPY